MAAIYHQSNTNNDCLYDTLSKLLTLNKNHLITFENCLVLKCKQSLEFNASVQIIRSINQEQQALLINLPFPVPKNVQMDIHRFIARLLQVFGLYKHRYSQMNGYDFLLDYLKEIQSVAVSYSLDKNSVRVLKKLIKVCQKYISKLQEGQFNFRQTYVANQQKQLKQNILKKAQQNSQQSTKIQRQTEKLGNFNKFFKNANKAYLNLNLDLDYTYFRSTFSNIKQSNSYFYEQMMERNKQIIKQITKYSKDFKDYTKRRSIKRQIIKKHKKEQLQKKKIRQNSLNYQTNAFKNKFISKQIINQFIKKPFDYSSYVQQTKDQVQHLETKDKKRKSFIQTPHQQQLRRIIPFYEENYDPIHYNTQSMYNESLYKQRYNKLSYKMKNVDIGKFQNINLIDTHYKDVKIKQLSSVFRNTQTLFKKTNGFNATKINVLTNYDKQEFQQRHNSYKISQQGPKTSKIKKISKGLSNRLEGQYSLNKEMKVPN